MTKDMIYNRTDALKTNVNLFFIKSVGRPVSQTLKWYYALLKFSKQAKWWRILIVFTNEWASSPIQIQDSTLLHVHFVFWRFMIKSRILLENITFDHVLYFCERGEAGGGLLFQKLSDITKVRYQFLKKWLFSCQEQQFYFKMTRSSNSNSLLNLVPLWLNPQNPLGAGGGGVLNKFNTGRLPPKVQPLTLLYTNLAEKVSLLYTLYWKKGTHYFRKSCSHFRFM